MAALNTSVTVGTTSTEVLAESKSLSKTIIINDSDETIYLAVGGPAVMNSGIRLNAAGGAVGLDGGFSAEQGVNAICESGSKKLTVFSSVSA